MTDSDFRSYVRREMRAMLPASFQAAVAIATSDPNPFLRLAALGRAVEIAAVMLPSDGPPAERPTPPAAGPGRV